MQPALLTIPALFATGLAASPHCWLMCGALQSIKIRGSGNLPAPAALGLLHAGRVAGYGLLGALAGAFGAGIAGLLPGPATTVAFRVAAALALIIVGIGSLRRREHACAGHAATSPGLSRSWLRPLMLGLGWSLMPCALLLSMLFLAGTTGSPGSGALLMLAFGVGSGPLMIMTGVAVKNMEGLRQKSRLIGAGALITVGAVSLAFALAALLDPFRIWCEGRLGGTLFLTFLS